MPAGLNAACVYGAIRYEHLATELRLANRTHSQPRAISIVRIEHEALLASSVAVQLLALTRPRLCIRVKLGRHPPRFRLAL